jgi:hypothetical protein
MKQERAMTESEWLAWRSDPGSLLNVVRDQISERKFRLFACACCRRIWHLLTDERSRKAVEVGELFADGRVDEEKLGVARTAAGAFAGPASKQAALAAFSAYHTVTLLGIWTFAAANRAASCLGPKKESEQKEQSRLFRDVICNPFRPVTIRSAILTWHDATVVRLAQAAYDERHSPSGTLDTSRLAVLADALEEAGCTSEDVLGHLRGPGPHVRGCWAIDLCLGKS